MIINRPPIISQLTLPGKILGFTLAGVVLLTLPQCSAYQLKSQEGKPVILETAGVNCRVVKKKALYSLLFGAIPLNPVEEGELFQGEGATYRVTDEVTTVDAVISSTLGWLLSLNRRTILVEACDENVRVANPESERKELDQILAGYARNSRAPIVILKDGKSYQGRIVEFSETEVAMETRESPEDGKDTGDGGDTSPDSGEKPTPLEGDSSTESDPDDSSAPIAYVDVVEMKNGQIKKGKVIAQNRVRIVLQSGDGSEEINKTKIQRVRYRVPESEVESEKSIVRIPRENIRKIVLP